MNVISDALRQHYSEKFSTYGPSSEGVDWGANESKMLLRYDKMLGVFSSKSLSKPSLLDVGCGYGGLLIYSLEKGISLDYTGIDIAVNMIEWASENCLSGKFICGNILDYDFEDRFDYLVCNGIMTQKLDIPALQMDIFVGQLIRKMFSLCKRGIVFNIMTTKVNYFANNLYYRNPAELFSWCLSEITPHIKLDHAYPLYEYTLYLYRDPVN